ncbi:MAG: hypothetical protein WB819_01310, partial [Terriglobia bacterium]
ELTSLDELKEAASCQGFELLWQVERAVLNPDESFAFKKRKDRAEDPSYQEILSRIDRLAELVGRKQPGEGATGG